MHHIGRRVWTVAAQGACTLMILVAGGVLWTASPVRAAEDTTPTRPMVMVFNEPVSVAQLISMLRNAGLGIVDGNAEDLSKKIFPGFNYNRPPAELLKLICLQANISCDYNKDLNVWQINRQTLKLPPMDTTPMGTDTSLSGAGSVSSSSSSSLSPAGYSQQSGGGGGSGSPIDVSSGGVPVDAVDMASAPAPKFIEGFVKVYNIDVHQMIALIMTGDSNSISDPFSVLPIKNLNPMGFVPGSYFSSQGGQTSQTGTSGTGSLGSAWNYQNAAGIGPYGGPQAQFSSSPVGQYGFHHSMREGDFLAQFPANNGGFPPGVAGGNPVIGGGTGPGGRNGAGGNGAANGNQNGGQNYGDLLPKGTKLLPFTLTNTIIAFTTPDGLRTLKQLVAALDKAPPNILIRVTKLIVNESATDAVGIDYAMGTPLFSIKTNTGATNTPGTVNINYLGSNIEATLFALQARSNTRTVAVPRIMLPDGVPGVISDLQVVPYVLPAVSGGAFGGGPTQLEISGATVTGLSIPILARLNWDGTITIYTFISDSQQGAAVVVPGGGSGPTAISTVSFPVPGVRVENGDTIVLGGFSSNGTTRSRQQVPILSDLPLIGGLFRSTTDTATRQEALYFITCNVVDVHGQSIPGGPDAVKRVLSQMATDEPVEEDTSMAFTNPGSTNLPAPGGPAPAAPALGGAPGAAPVAPPL